MEAGSESGSVLKGIGRAQTFKMSRSFLQILLFALATSILLHPKHALRPPPSQGPKSPLIVAGDFPSETSYSSAGVARLDHEWTWRKVSDASNQQSSFINRLNENSTEAPSFRATAGDWYGNTFIGGRFDTHSRIHREEIQLLITICQGCGHARPRPVCSTGPRPGKIEICQRTNERTNERTKELTDVRNRPPSITQT